MTNPPRRARIPPKLVWHSRKCRWVIVFYHPATLKRCFLTTPAGDRTNPGEAAQYLETHRDRIGAHRLGLGVLPSAAHAAVTVNRIADELEREYVDEKRRAGSSLRSALKHLRRELGAHTVETLTKATVLDARRRLVTTLSEATVNRVMAHLRRAWVVAHDRGLVSRPPTFRIPRFDEREYVREGFVTPEELAAVNAAEPWPAVRDRNEWAYRTGMRFGEIAGLTWDGFDPTTWTLRLHARAAKTKFGRVIRLSPALRAIIGRRFAERQLGCPWVFHHQGASLQDQGRWRYAWLRAGLPMRTTSTGRRAPAKIFHDLRRTAVRNMILAGVPEKTAMLISGHRTRVIFDRYNIVTEQQVGAALDLMDQYVGALPTLPALPVRQTVRRRSPLGFRRHSTAPAGTPARPDTKTASAPPAASA